MTEETTEIKISKFKNLGLNQALCDTLAKLGYEEPTPIQSAAITVITSGRDVIGQAATGTGKTAAYALPIIQKISTVAMRGVQPSTLILVPTRELALQVAEAIHSYGQAQKIRTVAIYGGQGYDQQLRALKKGVDIVIATPGRAIDHINRKTLRLDSVSTVVLDEADEMLDMGFVDDIEMILKETPKTKQVVLFSATLPPRVSGIAKRYLNNPEKISIVADYSKDSGIKPKIKQTVYFVPRAQKRLALCRILDVEDPTSAIIFCRTRTEVDELTEILNAHGRSAEALHGGLNQGQRENVLRRLREGIADLLIATDVAARGLDIDILSHVVNYDVPTSADSYVHRIGRVGRAGREGAAITLADHREGRLLRNIEYTTKQRIELAKVPTVADIRKHRLEQVKTTIREGIAEGDLETMRPIVESLVGEFDIMTIALAAAKLVSEAMGGDADNQEEIHEAPPERNRRGPRDQGPRQGQEGGRGRRESFARGVPMTPIVVNLGREDRIRPQDFVGAITGETGIPGRDIGSIDIGPRESLVEIASGRVDHVLSALRSVTIRGKRVNATLTNSRGFDS